MPQPATTSNRKRVASSINDLPVDSQLSSTRVVRRRVCIDAAPAEPSQPDPTLPSRGRPKRRLLESTSDFPTDFQFSRSRPVASSRGRPKRRLLESTNDFPTDFQFSRSRRVSSNQPQKPSDCPWRDTPTAALEEQDHQPCIPATLLAGTATSSGTHKQTRFKKKKEPPAYLGHDKISSAKIGYQMVICHYSALNAMNCNVIVIS
ncbi:hypothetical protein EJB05_49881 [Eragrostis curvula]|uniref:Uncharacterized protein n=1 Tax=Eragrostis curvula TaxID=38414 RepID=A0A5J9T601_9POAL|nr:hypothetical protein EJB05_49881 [Eragrostis curvula]